MDININESEYTDKLSQVQVDPEYMKKMQQKEQPKTVDFSKLSLNDKMKYVDSLTDKATKEQYRKSLRSEIIKLASKETDSKRRQTYLDYLTKYSTKDEIKARQKAMTDRYKERKAAEEEALAKRQNKQARKQIDNINSRVNDEKNASNYKFQQDNAEMIKKANKKDNSMTRNAAAMQHMADNPIKDQKDKEPYTGMNLFDHLKKQIQYHKDKAAQKKNLNQREQTLKSDYKSLDPVKQKLDEQIQKNKNYETKKRILRDRALKGR